MESFDYMTSTMTRKPTSTKISAILLARQPKLENLQTVSLLSPKESFVITKGGQQRASQGLHNNHLLKVSADGRTVEKLAYGLRQGFATVHPEDGRIYATDQQGNYIPSTPVHLIKKDAFLGFKEPNPNGKFPQLVNPYAGYPIRLPPPARICFGLQNMASELLVVGCC